MIKQIAILLLCFTTLNACGQSTANNAKAGKQVNIPGTRLFINPPEGFKVASNFAGLQKDNYTGLQVYDLVGGNYYTNAATFSREAFEQKGVTVFDYKETTINGYPAKYIYMQADATAKTYALVFGDTTFSATIMAFCPAADEEVSRRIRKAILSVTYNKKLKVDPFATAVFKLDDSKSKFKFAKASANVFIYSVNGVNKETYGDDEPMLMVNTLPADNTTTPSSIGGMLIGSLEKYGFTDKKLSYELTDKVNGYNAYEAVVYGNLKGQKTAIYQLVLLNKDKLVAIQGTAKNNYDSTIQDFKHLARTVTFKTQ